MSVIKRIVDFVLAVMVSLVSTPATDGGYAVSQAALDAPLSAHFIDVGQADGALVRLPDGKTMLIDAGDNKTGIKAVSYLANLGIERIDYLVATHPHADHIGGMDDVIDNFDIGRVYMPDVTANTKTFESMLDAIEKKNIPVTKAAAGVNIFSGDGISADIIAPNSAKYKELNDYSAVVRLVYGNTAFLFMGDAETLSEDEITADVRADVLKVGHHGSDTSSGENFILRVSPRVAVISVGEGNSYGHPNDAVMERLRRAGATVFRTDEDGTVVIGSDGENIIY